MGHKCRLTVRFNECDMYGHVNHTVYLSYLEYARIEYLKDISMSLNEFTKKGYYLVITKISIEYKAAAFMDDELDIYTKLIKKGRTNGVFKQEIYRNGTAIILAEVKWVCSNSKGKPVRLPNEFNEIKLN